MNALQYIGNKQFGIVPGTRRTPGSGEVTVKVAFTGICGTDMHIYHGRMDARVKPPSIIGHEMSGTVDAVGPAVEGIAPGDIATVRPLDYCGTCPACIAGHSHICQNLKFMGIDSPGSMQAYWTVKARTIHVLKKASLEHAALAEPIAVACHDVRMSAAKAGETAVVLGGGPIGMLIALVLMQKNVQVLLAEINPARSALARALGVTVIDPNAENIEARVLAMTGNAGADIVFEVTASAAGAGTMTKLLRTRGRAVVVGIFSEPPSIDLHRVFWRELSIIGVRVYEEEDFDEAVRLVEQKALPLDRMISKTFLITEAGQAFQFLGSTPDAMKVLIDCRS